MKANANPLIKAVGRHPWPGVVGTRYPMSTNQTRVKPVRVALRSAQSARRRDASSLTVAQTYEKAGTLDWPWGAPQDS